MVDASPPPAPKEKENRRSANRRVAERTAIRIEAICETTDVQGAPYYCTVLVISISTHGAGCIMPGNIERGKIVRLELTNAAQTVWHKCTARVCHTRPAGAGNSIIGCEFATPLEKDAYQQLLK